MWLHRGDAEVRREAQRMHLGIPLTQPNASGAVAWGGRPREGPCLRFRQRDGASRAVQGDRPTKPESARRAE